MRKIRKKKIRKNYIFVSIVCLCIMTITIGYSSLSHTLSIIGKTNIQMNWNIFLSDAVEIETQGASASSEITGRLTATFTPMILEQDGYVLYNVTVDNRGEMDAILKEIKGLEEVNASSGLMFTILNTEIEDIYLSKEQKTFQIRVEAKSEVTEYPITGSLNLELIFEKDPSGTGDITPPEVRPIILSTKTNAITIKSGCEDPESGISDYRYQQNDQEWIQAGNVYTFTGLKKGTYNFKVQCKNGMNLSAESGVFTGETKKLKVPTIEVQPHADDWASVKTVTITYDSEQDDFSYYYSMDEGITWLQVEGPVQQMEFKENGSVMAKIEDGVNEEISSKYLIDKIDGTIPPAPIITGGSTAWSSTPKTIQITTESTSPSGIKNYQYYLSTSNTSQTGGSWIDLDEGMQSVEIDTLGIHYIFMRAVNHAGTTGDISEPQTLKIDTTDPVDVIVKRETITSKSIEVSTTAKDPESGIEKIEFSKDAGNTWIDNGTNATYRFDNLKSGTYEIMVRVTNGNGIRKTSEIERIPTVELLVPTYRISTTEWATSKTVTITYPERQIDVIYEYSIDGGKTWITVSTGTTVSVKFTSSGTVIARIQDGINTITASSYTVDKIDTVAPTLTLSKITYQDGFNEWSTSNAQIGSDGVLTLAPTGTSGNAISPYYRIGPDPWYITYDGYTTTASSGHDSTTGSAGSGSGGVHVNTSYFDANYASVKAQNGYAGNGNAPQLPLNTWSNNFKFDGYAGYGPNIQYLRITFMTGTTYSQPVTKIRNFKVWGQMYSKFYLIQYKAQDNVGVKQVKYAKGNQSASYFDTSGTVASGDIRVTENGTYTVYVEDQVGNKKTSTIDITKVDTVAPTCTIGVNTTADSTSVVLTVNGNDSVSGLNTNPYSWTSSSSGFGTGKTKTVTANGTYTAWVKDAAGNVGSCSKAVTNIKTTYSITYNLDGGTNASSNTSTYTVSKGLTLANPTKTGYTFLGWYTDSGYTNKITSIPAGSTGNKTLYAKWRVNVLTICYNANGGTASSTASSNITTTCHKLNYGASLGTNGLYNQSTFGLKKSGYKAATGNEWGTTSTGGTYFNQDTVYTATQLYPSLGTSGDHTITLYAKWWIDTTVTGTANAKGYKMKMRINQTSWTRVSVIPMVVAGSAANSSGNANGRVVAGCNPGTDGNYAMPATHNSVFNFTSKGTTYYFNVSSYATQTSSSNVYYKGVTNSKGTTTTCTTSFSTVGTTTYLGSKFSVSKQITMPSG